MVSWVEKAQTLVMPEEEEAHIHGARDKSRPFSNCSEAYKYCWYRDNALMILIHGWANV